MTQRVQDEDEDKEPKMPAQASRPAQINVYRAFLALERRGPLSARDAAALEGLRASLLGSGGLPVDEED